MEDSLVNLPTYLEPKLVFIFVTRFQPKILGSCEKAIRWLKNGTLAWNQFQSLPHLRDAYMNGFGNITAAGTPTCHPQLALLYHYEALIPDKVRTRDCRNLPFRSDSSRVQASKYRGDWIWNLLSSMGVIATVILPEGKRWSQNYM